MRLATNRAGHATPAQRDAGPIDTQRRGRPILFMSAAPQCKGDLLLLTVDSDAAAGRSGAARAADYAMLASSF